MGISIKGAKRGDTGETRRVQLLHRVNRVEVPADLSEALSIVTNVELGRLKATLTTTFEDKPTGIIVISLGVDEDGWLFTAKPGEWHVEYDVDFPDGKRTWPNEGYDTLRVWDQLG